MGKCIYCGQSSGLFGRPHKDCEKSHKETQLLMASGEMKIVETIQSSISVGENPALTERNILSLLSQFGIHPERLRSILIRGWEKSVTDSLEVGILNIQEEQRLTRFLQHFRLNQEELNHNGWMTRLVQSAILRDVIEGKIPQRVTLNSSLGINLQRGEKVIWVFSDTRYLEDKTRRHIEGTSQGVSLRLMKGVTYRVGQFKGKPVETTERVHADTGRLIITDKHLYFSGPIKSFRVSYSNIVSFQAYSDGFGIMRDGVTAKAQVFVTGEGWFGYNLVINLSQM
jgi:hypothetical protein